MSFHGRHTHHFGLHNVHSHVVNVPRDVSHHVHSHSRPCIVRRNVAASGAASSASFWYTASIIIPETASVIASEGLIRESDDAVPSVNVAPNKFNIQKEGDLASPVQALFAAHGGLVVRKFDQNDAFGFPVRAFRQEIHVDHVAVRRAEAFDVCIRRPPLQIRDVDGRSRFLCLDGISVTARSFLFRRRYGRFRFYRFFFDVRVRLETGRKGFRPFVVADALSEIVHLAIDVILDARIVCVCEKKNHASLPVLRVRRHRPETHGVSCKEFDAFPTGFCGKRVVRIAPIERRSVCFVKAEISLTFR